MSRGRFEEWLDEGETIRELKELSEAYGLLNDRIDIQNIQNYATHFSHAQKLVLDAKHHIPKIESLAKRVRNDLVKYRGSKALATEEQIVINTTEKIKKKLEEIELDLRYLTGFVMQQNLVLRQRGDALRTLIGIREKLLALIAALRGLFAFEKEIERRV